MPQLTKRAVDGTQPSDRDVYLWDDEIRGFGLKVTPRGRKVYLYQYRYPKGRSGRTRRCTIGTHGELSPSQARKRALVLAAAVTEGRDPYEEQAAERRQASQEMTVTMLRNAWLKAFEAQVRTGDRSPRTLRDYGTVSDQMLLPHIGRRKAKTITAQDVQDLKAELTEKRGSAQANLALIPTCKKCDSLRTC